MLIRPSRLLPRSGPLLLVYAPKQGLTGVSEPLGATDTYSLETLTLNKHLSACVLNFWVTQVFMECLGWPARSRETAAPSQVGAAWVPACAVHTQLDMDSAAASSSPGVALPSPLPGVSAPHTFSCLTPQHPGRSPSPAAAPPTSAPEPHFPPPTPHAALFGAPATCLSVIRPPTRPQARGRHRVQGLAPQMPPQVKECLCSLKKAGVHLRLRCLKAEETSCISI